MRVQQPADQGVRPSPIFFAIVTLTAVAGVVASIGENVQFNRVALFGFVLGAWTVTLIFHEFAHAFTAWTGGDRSVAQRGYLRLDPRDYTHPVMSLALPLLFIVMGGLAFPGGAVLINRSVLSPARASLVALVGPLTNLAFGAICLLTVSSGVLGEPYSIFTTGVAFFGFLQIAVFVLNMLPVPGFDGFAVIEAFLPPSTQQLLRPVAAYGPLLAILLIWRQPQVASTFFTVIDGIVGLFGVDDIQRYCGYESFAFWEQADEGCVVGWTLPAQ